MYQYNVDENYDFTLYIYAQYNGIIETAVRAHIASTDIQQVTIESLDAQMRSNSKSYVGYPIRLTARIEIDDLHGSIKIVNGEGKVLIYLDSDENSYIEGQTYTFLLFVHYMDSSVVEVYPLKP